MYAFDPATGGFVVFHSFPVRLLLRRVPPVSPHSASDGNLYGLTVCGGNIGFGTIFRVTPSGDFTEIHVFTGPDGERPYDALIQASDGYLYGGARSAARICSGAPTGLGYSTAAARSFAPISPAT